MATQPEVIGEVDFSSALTTVHPKAIYLHQGQQYHVERLDFDERKAYVKPRERRLLHRRDSLHPGARAGIAEEESASREPAARAHGDVLVRSQVVGLQENQILHQRKYGRRTSSNCRKTKCTPPHSGSRSSAALLEALAFRVFGSPERNFRPAARPGIHGYAAADVRPRDLGTAVGERPASPGVKPEWQEFPAASELRKKEFFEPNLYLYDAYPGGIGFSEPLYRVHDLLLRRTRELIVACPARAAALPASGRLEKERADEGSRAGHLGCLAHRAPAIQDRYERIGA